MFWEWKQTLAQFSCFPTWFLRIVQVSGRIPQSYHWIWGHPVLCVFLSHCKVFPALSCIRVDGLHTCLCAESGLHEFVCMHLCRDVLTWLSRECSLAPNHPETCLYGLDSTVSFCRLPVHPAARPKSKGESGSHYCKKGL